MRARRIVATALSTLLLSALMPVGGPATAATGQSVQDLDTVTPTQLANALVGADVTVSDATFTGSNQAAGKFDGFSAVGFAQGVVLGSGSVSDVVGPNESGSTTTSFDTAGDPALDALASYPTQDASVLRFNFVPQADQVRFDYVFGSEEYDEYVGSDYNDVFGFYVNGKNCAVTPGGKPVSINTINAGTSAALYRSNSAGKINVEPDGLTTVLSCNASVNPGVKNTMKLAIADASDGSFDSSVFLKAGSLSTNEAPIAQDSSVTARAGEATPVSLVATDPDGDALTYQVVTGPQQGSLTGTGANRTYTSAAGYVGADSLTFRASDGVAQSNLATVSFDVVAGCTITGTKNADVLRGTPGDDVICGLKGRDKLFGLEGDDTLLGGADGDQLIGGPGDDDLAGGPDNDALRGDEGADYLDGGSGQDIAAYLSAPAGVSVDLAAGTANAGSHGVDVLTNLEGAAGSRFADKLMGDAQGNQLYGLTGNDVLTGLGGADELQAAGGDDRLLGRDGRDLLVGAAGVDDLNGGAKFDICYSGGGQRRGCEAGNDKDTGKDTGARHTVASHTRSGGPQASGPQASLPSRYWYMGNGDYLFVYSVEDTLKLDPDNFASASGWEGAVCRVLKYTPVKSACSATSALQSIEKWQLKWFLNRASAQSKCFPVIWDYGRHGVNQFKKRWKARSAQSIVTKVAEAWVTPGRWSYIKTSDPSEVGGRQYRAVTC